MVFFSRGWTIACLKHVGTMPETRRELIIAWMLGPVASKVPLITPEGITSLGEVLGFICMAILVLGHGNRFEVIKSRQARNCVKTESALPLNKEYGRHLSLMFPHYALHE